MSFRIAVDAMGGDHAPEAIVRGAIDALSDSDDIELILVGDEPRIHGAMSLNVGCSSNGDGTPDGAPVDGASVDGAPVDGASQSSVPRNGLADRIRVLHASETIGMGESPVVALRQKKDSSLLRVAQLGADGEADAVLSAGNTGAYAAACQLKMRPLPCISRPGIAVTIPTYYGPFVLCDVGANIYAKPHHLYEYAVMASLYAEQLLSIESPRVALLSIGEESLKGTELVRQAHALLKADDRIRFVGNLEGRDLFNDFCDVAVCDGFVGNIILKLAEGLSEGLFRMFEAEMDSLGENVASDFAAVFKGVKSRHDYSEYGGAPLLGVDGTCIICHGRSNALAIRNAVLTAHRFRRLGFNEAIVSRFESD